MTPIATYYMCDYQMCTEPIEWNMPKSTSKELPYTSPNRELICVSYWMCQIQKYTS